jgi:hypothetical protein
VKGVRVRICDKKWLYGSCILKSFSFGKKHVQVISGGDDFKPGLTKEIKVKLRKSDFLEENCAAIKVQPGVRSGKLQRQLLVFRARKQLIELNRNKSRRINRKD